MPLVPVPRPVNDGHLHRIPTNRREERLLRLLIDLRHILNGTKLVSTVQCRTRGPGLSRDDKDNAHRLRSHGMAWQGKVTSTSRQLLESRHPIPNSLDHHIPSYS